MPESHCHASELTRACTELVEDLIIAGAAPSNRFNHRQ